MSRPLAVLLLCLAASLPAHALTVTWEAPQPLRKVFEENLKPPAVEPGERRRAALRPWERDVRRRVPEIAGSEG